MKARHGPDPAIHVFALPHKDLGMTSESAITEGESMAKHAMVPEELAKTFSTEKTRPMR
jgi:hypothetical protein